MPFWLWPWCAFLFLLPFKQVLSGPVFPLLELAGAITIALAPRPRAPLAPARFLAVTLLTLILCASYFSSVLPEATETGLMRVAMAYLAYVCLTSVRLTVADFLLTLRAWLLGGAAAAAVTLLAYMQGRTTEDGRAVLILFGLASDPNYLAAELLVPLGLGLHFARRPGSRWWSIPLAAVLGGAIVLTQSRGGLLAALLMLAVFLALEKRWRTLLCSGAVLVGLYVLFAASLGRLDLSEDPTGSHRTTIWRLLLPMAVQHMATGVGLDASMALTANAAGFYRPLGTHNTYVQAFVETGLPGLLALLAVLATHMRARAPAFPALRASLFGLAFAALFLQCLSYQLLWIPWIAIAQAAVLQRREQPAPAQKPRPLAGIGDHHVYLAKD